MVKYKAVGAAALLVLASCNLLVPVGDHDLAPPEGAGSGSPGTDAATPTEGGVALPSSDGGLLPDGGDGGGPPADGGGPLVVGDLVVIASAQNGPRGVAVDRTFVYWVNPNDKAVLRSPKVNPAPQTIASQQDGLNDIVTDGATLFWTGAYIGSNVGQLRSSAPDGTNHHDLGGNNWTGSPVRLLAIGASVFGTDTTVVDRWDKQSGSMTELVHGGGLSGLAILGANLYVGAGTGLFSAPLSGGALAPIGAAQPRPADLAADGLSLYWATEAGTVHRLDDTAGAQPQQLATGQSVCARVAIDALNVYWTSSNGTVATVPKSGGAVRVLASGQGSPFGIVVDGDGVYWTTGDTVMMLKKKP
jgi:hypothetical protein